MPRNLHILFILLLGTIRGAGQDLLANGDFEDENICTEYQVNCAPEAWISSSSGFSTYLRDAGQAYQGLHSMILEAGRTRARYQRTYLRTQLLCGLRKGHRYRFTCFVKARLPILDSIGILFTPHDFLFDKRPLQTITPSAYFAGAGTAAPARQDTGWQQVSLEYTASGEERFLAIGNFARRDLNGETGLPLESHFLVLIDQVSLRPLDPQEQLCDDWQLTRTRLYEQNERHEFLDRLVRFYRSQNKMPAPPPLTPTRVRRIDTLVLPDLLFATGQHQLQPASHAILDSFCQQLHGTRLDSLIIEGYADSTGTGEGNRLLARQRAETVAGYLRERLPQSERVLVTRSWGALRPIADNRTPAGRQRNRRVEILAYRSD
ncbi:MAG TPA: OmpA family protein [Chitinophagaceae bacterium]|nr:OmpA family protein [Chitinophagaceae bacterium]